MKCGIGNDTNITRCSFCSAPKPADPLAREKQEQISNTEKLKLTLHNAIEKMNHNQRTNVWRWMEDNVL